MSNVTRMIATSCYVVLLACNVAATDLDDDSEEDNGWIVFGESRPVTHDSSDPRVSLRRWGWSAYAEDLDCDGDTDVLSASWDRKAFAHLVEWHENLGNGQFSERRVIAANPDSYFELGNAGFGATHPVHATDFSGDGIADVVFVSFNQIYWNENIGCGEFSKARDAVVDRSLFRILRYNPIDIHSVDINDDGYNDLLVANYYSVPTDRISNSYIAWHAFTGDGFASRLTISYENSPTSVHAADIDGDGDADVLSTSHDDDKVAWYENMGGGEFSTQKIITAEADGPVWVLTADVDGDADADVLSLSGKDRMVAWYENTGNGIFSERHVIAENLDPRLAQAVDFDGDGDVDILYVGSVIAWFENHSNGSFSKHPIVAYSFNYVHGSRAIAHAVDIDGDGDADVVAASAFNNIEWYENIGFHSFWRAHVVAVEDDIRQAHAADVDGDGDLDLLASSIAHDRIFWLENLGDGEFSKPRDIARDADGVWSVGTVDIDGDGDLDVLSASVEDSVIGIEPSPFGGVDGIAWYENHGRGEFSRVRNVATDVDRPVSIVSVDLDDDGDPDVLSASYDSGTIAWHTNSGGTFSSRKIISDDAGSALSVSASDLDGDGDFDVLSTSAGDGSAGDGKVAWYKNLGVGVFSEERVIGRVSLPIVVQTSDLDGDGDEDVFYSSMLNGAGWYENLGGGDFSVGRTIVADGYGARFVRAADFDGDGDPDLLSASRRTGKIAWHENHGGGIFSDQRKYVGEVMELPRSYRLYRLEGPDDGGVELPDIALSPGSQVLDFDGDGDVDVLSVSPRDRRIVWFENRVQPPATAPTVAPEGVRVVPGARLLTVSWESVPEDADGGSTITAHVAVASSTDGGPGFQCQTRPDGDSCVISGLAPDVFVYEVTVHAENAVGAGPRSAPVSATPVGSRRLVGEGAGDAVGWSLARGAGGGAVVGAPFHSTGGRDAAGAVYLVAAADLSAADAADDGDHQQDGVVGLGDVAGQDASWKLVGESAGDAAGWSVAAAAGHDGEEATRAYAAVGAPREGGGAGAVYLVAAADLAAADAADDNEDGVADLGNVAAQDSSWKIVGGAGDRFGASVGSAGDVDGDGHAELLVHGAAERRGAGFGAAFVLSLDDADLAAADEADGHADGVIESRRLAARSNFWEISGTSVGGRAGDALAALGDTDGDGYDDLLVGAPRRTLGGDAFLAAGGDLPDGSDGLVDVADLADLDEHPKSYRFVGEASFDSAGASVAGAGDINDDDRADLIVGAPGHSGRAAFAGGAAYLIASSSLAAADRADLESDGTVALGNVADQSDSWKLVGARPFEGAGSGLSSAGDLDGDGVADLLIGSYASGAYLIAVADLAAMDEADGSEDGTIDLANVAAQDNSWRIAGRGRIVGRDLRLSPIGDVDGDGGPDVLLAASGTVWLLAAADLPVVLANFDAADGTTDGVVDFGVLTERIGAPRGGGALVGSVELYQGPLARTWNSPAGVSEVHVPPIIGRRAALVANVDHTAPTAPELSVSVLNAGGAPFADGLRLLREPKTSPPKRAGDRWRTDYVLDLPGEFHQAGNRVRFGFAGEDDGGAIIEFDGLALPRFDIAFVPIRSLSGEPPSIDANAYLAPVLDLLPIADHQARVGATLDFQGDAWSAREAAFQLLRRWNAEAGANEIYHGVFIHPGDGSACGHAFLGGPVSVSAAPGGTCPVGAAVRGVGSNLSLRPAPGCGAAGADPRFPYPLGGIGSRRGWLLRTGRFVDPDDGFTDFMSGCHPAFVSDYHYRKATDFRGERGRSVTDALAPTSCPTCGSLALTGLVDANGQWSMSPVLATHLPARVPRTGGSHVVALLSASGRELHRQPLTVYAASSGGGGWTARVPVPDGHARFVIVRAPDGRVLMEERIVPVTVEAAAVEASVTP